MNRAGLIETFGHSQNTGYGTAGPEYAWPALVAAELGAYDANYASNNLILAGNGNGYSRYVRPAAASRNRTAAPYLAPADVVFANVGTLDLANNYVNNGVVTPRPFANAMRAALAFAQLGGYFPAEPAGASHPSIAYGGAWVDVTVPDASVGAGWRGSMTSGATLTITVPADFPGGDILLFWIAGPSGATSTATWDIQVTGATATTLRDTIGLADVDPITANRYNMKATRITGLNPGAHTIVVTGQFTGFGAGFDGWGIRAPISPDLVVVKQSRMTAQLYEAWLGPAPGDTPNDATMGRLNRDLQALAVEHGARWLELPELTLDPVRYTVSDGAHPNEAAHRQFADAALDFLAAVPDTSRNAPLSTTAPAFAAGWGNDTAPYANTVLRRAAPRQIVMSGRAKRTGTPTVGETICTIPEGMRPGASHAYVAPGSTATPVVTVASDGTVKYTSGTLGAGATVDLDGIEWTAGQ